MTEDISDRENSNYYKELESSAKPISILNLLKILKTL